MARMIIKGVAYIWRPNGFPDLQLKWHETTYVLNWQCNRTANPRLQLTCVHNQHLTFSSLYDSLASFLVVLMLANGLLLFTWQSFFPSIVPAKSSIPTQVSYRVALRGCTARRWTYQRIDRSCANYLIRQVRVRQLKYNQCTCIVQRNSK